ncbi:acyl carrier protein [Pseudoalteromonas 'SMAR']|uniref:acyl carrier protein n=1 Tax=Pseudoalteromonas 'SMAR' TaxID=3416908 RepID=UPI003AF2F444
MNEKLQHIFAEVLDIPLDEVNDELAYGQHDKWDSMTHMMLIADIEANFDIMIDTNDIIDMSSFAKAKEIVAKYGV